MKQTNKEFERANEDKFGAFGMHAAPGKIASSFRWGGGGGNGEGCPRTSPKCGLHVVLVLLPAFNQASTRAYLALLIASLISFSVRPALMAARAVTCFV